MNFQESNRGGDLRVLKRPAPAHGNERPMAARIGSLEAECQNTSFVKCREVFDR